MEGLFNKLVSSFAGDKPGKDYWVDDSKCKACYECDTSFSAFVRRHHCRVCGRVFCGSCSNHELPPPRDSPDQTWLRVCTYCYHLRQRTNHTSSGPNGVLHHSHSTAAGGPGPPSEQRPGVHLLRSRPGTSSSSLSSSPSSSSASGSRALRHTHSHHQRGHTDAALTWEVPLALDKQFGPSLAAVLAAATEEAPADSQSSSSSAAPDGAAAMPGSSNSSSSSPVPPLAGGRQQHPLVLLYRQEFEAAAQAHLQRLVRQLLAAEEVGQAEAWEGVLVRLATQAAVTILPAAAAAHGEQDPRYYVKVKRLPDVGTPASSCVVAGVVAKKNVANRKMRTSIDNARVLLLAGALEYQRVNHKLSSFDTLLEQEREHLRLAVARVAAVQPDVLLVEASVARAAQEELLARGISLVQHVKRELLERLERHTGAKVLQSIEELTVQAVGTCQHFRVEQLPPPATPPAAASPSSSQGSAALSAATASAAAGAAAPHPGHVRQVPAAAAAGPKTLMLFQGCPQPLGCTLLLYGGSADQLVRVKRVAKFAVLAAYHLSLEASFLAEELALATAALATEGMTTEDVDVFRGLAQDVVRPSLAAACPGPPDSLSLSLSPHVVNPALIEAQAAHARRLQALLGQQAPQQQQGEEEEVAAAAAGLPGSLQVCIAAAAAGDAGDLGAVSTPQTAEPATPPLASYSSNGGRASAAGGAGREAGGSSMLTAASVAAAGAEGGGRDIPDHPLALDASDVSDGSARAGGQQQQVGAADSNLAGSPQVGGNRALSHSSSTATSREADFTDPLRRKSAADESALSGGSEGVGGGSQLQWQASGAQEQLAAAAAAVEEEERGWRLEGLKLYDRQRIFLSMACRNPRRQLMCEPPAIKRIDYYCHSDLSLAGFIGAAAPHPAKKCQAAGCGDGVTAHVRTFLHGGARLTLSIATLPGAEALPGEDRGVVWTWLRPKGSNAEVARHVRRLPLSPDTCCLSFGMFLQLCFAAPALELCGRPLHSAFVRYFGCGRTVMCLHQDLIAPSGVTMPALPLPYSLNAQLMWLKQEAAELCQESNEAFDILEGALMHHPCLARQAAAAAAAAAAALDTRNGTPASGDALAGGTGGGGGALASGSNTPHSHKDEGGPPVAGSSNSSSPTPTSYMPVAAAPELVLPSLGAMLSAVRKDRSSFMERVKACVLAATPMTPRQAGQPWAPSGRSSSKGSLTEQALVEEERGGGGAFQYEEEAYWDEQLISGMAELNRLRRSLAITVLTWAATVQEPSLFAQALGAATAPTDSPLAAMAASTGEGAAAASMFHYTTAAAAARLSAAAAAAGDSNGGDGGRGVAEGSQSVPLLANPLGPIAVDAVAHLVADCVACDSGAAGGLLAGSQTVLKAIARASEGGSGSLSRTGSFSGAVPGVEGPTQQQQQQQSSSRGLGASGAASPSSAAASPAKLKSYISRKLLDPTSGGGAQAGAAAAAAGGGVEQGSGPALGGSTGASSPRGQHSRRGSWGAASRHSGTDTPGGASDDEDEEGEVTHDRFVSWLTSHEIGAPLEEDLSEFYPEQPDWEEGGASRPAPATGATGGGDPDSSALPVAASSRSLGGVGPSSGNCSSSCPTQTQQQQQSEAAPRPPTPPGTPEPSVHGAADMSSSRAALPSSAASLASTSAAAAAAAGGQASASLTFEQLKAQLQQQQAGANQTRRGSCGGLLLPSEAAASSGRGGAAAGEEEPQGSRSGMLRSLSPSFHRRSASEGVLLPGEAAAAAAAAAASAVHTPSRGLPSPGLDAAAAGLPPASGAGLPRIRTASAPIPAPTPPLLQQQQQQRRGGGLPGSLGSTGTPGAGGSPFMRIQLPGRVLLPAGVNDTVIPIFDSEPTSIVAYFLCTRSYQMQLNAAIKGIFQEGRRGGGGAPTTTSFGAGSGNGAGAGSGANSTASSQQQQQQQIRRSTSSGHARSGSMDKAMAQGASAAAGSASASAVSAAAGGILSAADRGSGSPGSSSGTQQAGGGFVAASNGNGSGGNVAGRVGRGGSSSPSKATVDAARVADLEWLSLLLSNEPCHVKDVFDDDSPGTPWLRARFGVTAHYAPQFAELRRRCIAGGEAAYVNSLSRCRKWASRGGKSNAYFAKSRDDRFIIKSLSKPEKASFLEFAPAYFEHMAGSLQTGRLTCLAKVAGVYSITFRAAVPGAGGGGGGGGGGGNSSSLPYKDGTLDVVVMENIFYDRQISRIYDLKGSERSRFNADAAANPQDAGEVHLDDNLRRSNLQAPILVEQGCLRAMERALWADTSFLSGLGVMDYSLLVGVDKEANALVVAIIDFIRTYTWDKQLETWVKSSGILGGNGKEPTIVSPRQYMRRFRSAIAGYFTVVPDAGEVEPPLDPDAA